MEIHGLGQTPEPNQNQDTGALHQNPKGQSIWAQYNDSNGVVDANDVKYKEGAKADNKITAFLEKHKGESWTQMLKMQLDSLIQFYNMQQDSNRRFEQMSGATFGNDPFAEYNNFKNKTLNEFNGFKEESGKLMMNFQSETIKEQKEFVKEGINKILDKLKDGYNGSVTIEGVGIITYNAEDGEYTMQYNDSSMEYLDSARLNQVIEEAIDNGASISGYAQKMVIK